MLEDCALAHSVASRGSKNGRVNPASCGRSIRRIFFSRWQALLVDACDATAVDHLARFSSLRFTALADLFARASDLFCVRKEELALLRLLSGSDAAGSLSTFALLRWRAFADTESMLSIVLGRYGESLIRQLSYGRISDRCDYFNLHRLVIELEKLVVGMLMTHFSRFC